MRVEGGAYKKSVHGLLSVPEVGLVGNPRVGGVGGCDERVHLPVLLETLHQRLARLRALYAPACLLLRQSLALHTTILVCWHASMLDEFHFK